MELHQNSPEEQAVLDSVERLAAVDHSTAEVPVVVDPTVAILDAAGDGSIFTKERGAWRVQFVKNGHPLACSGATIPDAVASIGAVRTHDSLGNVI